MIKKLSHYLLLRVKNLKDYLAWYYRKDSYESVYFYTFHKCASSLFSGYILKNINGLRHVDYAIQIYRGEETGNIIFKKNGFIYGPLRLSLDPVSPEYKKLVGPVSNIDFIQNKTAVFLIRDPRDILISTYYSFGYSHGLSNVDEIRTLQEQKRHEILNKSADEYALESAPRILANFKTLDMLYRACNQSVVLKYEDMIDHWDYFVEGLTKYLDIREKILTQIYNKSRPQEIENMELHKRSGKPGQFRCKLTKATIKSLNTTFADILERFHYTV